MGYDVMVLDATELQSFAAIELSPDEQEAIAQVARANRMAVLSAFPEYWGDEVEIPQRRLRDLRSELLRAEGLAELSPEARSGVRKLRGMVEVASARARPLLIVPD